MTGIEDAIPAMIAGIQTFNDLMEKKIMKDRYFEEVIDPILKKISTHGKESLTKEEQKKLNNYKR